MIGSVEPDMKLKDEGKKGRMRGRLGSPDSSIECLQTWCCSAVLPCCRCCRLTPKRVAKRRFHACVNYSNVKQQLSTASGQTRTELWRGLPGPHEPGRLVERRGWAGPRPLDCGQVEQCHDLSFHSTVRRMAAAESNLSESCRFGLPFQRINL